MNTLRELGEFVGLGKATPRSKLGEPLKRKPITLRSVSYNLHILSSSQRSSMREMILALPTLPPITLEVEPVGRYTGQDGAWVPQFKIYPASGCILSTALEISGNNKVLFRSNREEDVVMNNGGVFGYHQIWNGVFQYKITRTGVQNTGITSLEKSIEFIARKVSPTPPNPPPPNPPVPPASELQLKVVNQSGGHFLIAGVTWTVWQQTISGFSLLATVSGASVTVQPKAQGQYHIHVDVAATRNATGLNELAEFRGTATGPGGAKTLVIVWPGSNQSRSFRLMTEGQPNDIFNPVVVLES